MMEIIVLKIAGGLPHILTERTKENEENKKVSNTSLINFLEVQCKKRLYIYISKQTGGERNEKKERKRNTP